MAAAYWDHTLKFWDITSGNCIRVIQAHEYLVMHNFNLVLSSAFTLFLGMCEGFLLDRISQSK